MNAATGPDSGSSLAQTLATRGWARFPADAASEGWAGAALDVARDVVQDPEMQATWLQCEGTWFVGVDALPNTAAGAVGGVPLDGAAVSALGPLPPLHSAQVSVTYPGYPKPRAGETEAAYGYRLRRDAAHVDGLLPCGPERRRMIREPHAFILGIALTEATADASPLVVWEGSPAIMREALARALAPHARDSWADVDVTAAYQAARKTCFAQCTRRPVPLAPGEAVIVHRLALHGIAPWEATATAAPEGRMTAYFRPLMPGGVSDWLNATHPCWG